MKNLFITAVTIICLPFFYSCGSLTVTVKQFDIDSAVRRVVPEHNCSCVDNGKSVKLFKVKDGYVNNMYYWQIVYVKKESSTDYQEQAIKIKKELISLVPTMKNYKRVFIEFRVNTTEKTDTAFSSTNIGTAYFIANSCNGFATGKTHQELLKATKTKNKINSFCKTNN
ncbi:MAG: hypothetical protein WCI49_16545 [Ferruginibacter sp.]